MRSSLTSSPEPGPGDAAAASRVGRLPCPDATWRGPQPDPKKHTGQTPLDRAPTEHRCPARLKAPELTHAGFEKQCDPVTYGDAVIECDGEPRWGLGPNNKKETRP